MKNNNKSPWVYKKEQGDASRFCTCCSFFRYLLSSLWEMLKSILPAKRPKRNNFLRFCKMTVQAAFYGKFNDHHLFLVSFIHVSYACSSFSGAGIYVE